MKLPPARATIAIVVANAAVWLLIQMGGLGEVAAWSLGFIPRRMSDASIDQAILDLAAGSGHPHLVLVPAWLTPLTAAFTQLDFVHLAFNLVIVGFCGRFVELGLGSKGFVTLYLVGALAAAAAHYLSMPQSLVPAIGASGAGSAVIAAYALLYGSPRKITANRRVNRLLNIVWLAAAWIGLQLLIAYANTAVEGLSIAFMAHIGGFVAGLLLARPLLLLRYRNA